MNLFSFVPLNILYPRRCPVCDEPVSPRGSLICNSCKDIIPLLESPLCFKCGRKLFDSSQEYCELCLKQPPSFDRGFSLWEYGKLPVRQSIARFKYKGRREYSLYYADCLFRAFPFLFSKKAVSAIIPIPIHKKRQNSRGYNQAELLASLLSQKSDIPLILDLLIRTKNTKPQNKLTSTDRKKNLQDAFSINPSSSSFSTHLHSVLLIDDIYTTGNTTNICSSLLKEIGVSHVYVLCLSSTSI